MSVVQENTKASLTETSYEGFDEVRKVNKDDAARGSLKNNFPGISAKHGFIVHTNGEPNGKCRVTYDLAGRFQTLSGTVHARPHRGSPLFAEIIGDGKSLWKSGNLVALENIGASFEIDVSGVRQLILVGTSENDIFAGHVLWKNPLLIPPAAGSPSPNAAP